MTHSHRWAIKTLVPEEVYTDRQYFLDYFYQAALTAATRRTTSTVLLGQRRMGKTQSRTPMLVQYSRAVVHL